MSTAVDVRRAESRAPTDFGWLDSKHSFSFGRHYDPANTGHGSLIVLNDDRVAPGGRLRHALPSRHGDRHVGARRRARTPRLGRQPWRPVSRARAAHVGRPGHTALRDERQHTEPVHFVQMWVVPDTRRHRTRLRTARLQRAPRRRRARRRRLRARATRRHLDHQAARRCGSAACSPAKTVELPDAPFVHVFVAAGLDTGRPTLEAGDAARLTAAGTSLAANRAKRDHRVGI